MIAITKVRTRSKAVYLERLERCISGAVYLERCIWDKHCHEFRTAGWINDIQSSRDQIIPQHEVQHAIVASKTNISPGPDQITRLQLKLGIESIAPHLTASLNQVLTNARTPEDGKTVKISLLPKTTKPKKLKDYRPVALSSITSKLFTKILTKRITAKSEDYLEESQAGFRRGRGCADNIQVVSQI
uniref:Reverse transcriptase domain-containing protein n=1 Tax=Caenorhabditis japonica TaxID=281687 RepID=A0A8R1E543_CAEJA